MAKLTQKKKKKKPKKKKKKRKKEKRQRKKKRLGRFSKKWFWFRTQSLSAAVL